MIIGGDEMILYRIAVILAVFKELKRVFDVR
jgi:hypothetical protein